MATLQVGLQLPLSTAAICRPKKTKKKGHSVGNSVPPAPSFALLLGNVVHLVSAGGQHHIISQPAQVALIQAMAQQAGQAPVGMQAVPGHQPPTILPVPATSAAAAAVASTTAITVPIATTQGEFTTAEEPRSLQLQGGSLG